jgi:hypothetical protein
MRLRSSRNYSSRNERQVTTNDTAKVYAAVVSTRPYSTQPLYFIAHDGNRNMD